MGDEWQDLRERLTAANESLQRIAKDAGNQDGTNRLNAKAAGVRLALSYMDDHDRAREEL